MTETPGAPSRASTRTSRIIKAAPNRLYEAFIDPVALAEWMPPGEMTGEIHAFTAGIGGGYTMSLFYPDDLAARGKTTAREDRVHVRFVDLVPPCRIVEAVTFDSPDPAFHGEMTMVITFAEVTGGIDVVLLCSNLPPGLRPEDNDAGARLSLEQLARRFE